MGFCDASSADGEQGIQALALTEREPSHYGGLNRPTLQLRCSVAKKTLDYCRYRSIRLSDHAAEHHRVNISLPPSPPCV